MLSTLYTILLDGLLRPARFLAYLCGGRRPLGFAMLATFVLLCATVLAQVLILGQFIQLDERALLVGWSLALVFSWLMCMVSLALTGLRAEPRQLWTFGLLRSLIAIAPPASTFFVVVYSQANSWMQRDPLVILLFLVLAGAWIGGAIATSLALRQQHAESRAARSVVGAGAIAIGAALLLSPIMRETGASVLAAVCIGLSIGVVRPISYLWEAPLSAVLVVVATAGISPRQLRALHPIDYDELGLLRLPGTSRLMARLDDDAWLLRVAQHPTHYRAAQRAVARIVRDDDRAHALLFRLSTSEAGGALLRAIVEEARHVHPLVAAYAALVQHDTPEAWPVIVAQLRPMITAATLPGECALLVFLDTGAGVLRADRWELAIERLYAAPRPEGVETDTLWSLLETIRQWADSQYTALVMNRAQASEAIWSEPVGLDGWPARLVAAIVEHLSFLLSIEQCRSGSACR